jgi:hypothetical protein
MTNDYQPDRAFSNKPIILGADEQPIEGNSNTQQLDNPNLTGSIIPSGFMDKLNPAMQEYFMEESLKANREALRREIIAKGKTELTDEDATMFKAPRKGCNKCHGTGRVGWSSFTNEVVICDCMRRGRLLDSSPEEFIPYKQFMEIFMVEKPGYPRFHTTPKSVRRVESKERKLAKKRRKHGISTKVIQGSN